MKKLRIGLFIFAVIIIIVQALLVNYNNLAWRVNAGSYLGIISMLLLLFLLILSIRSERNNKN